jgi:hypothetical protein
MSRASLYPDPPHVSAAFYLDHAIPAEAFLGVGERVIAAGGIPTGSVKFVRAVTFPRFAMLSDLASQVESVQLDLGRKQKAEAWRRWLQTQDPTVHVLRAGFEVPRAGPVVVAFERIPDESAADTLHPVAVTMSGSLVSMPDHVTLSVRERRQAMAVVTFLMTVFRSVCESLDPLYGMIGVEASLPTPRELVTGHARVGTELFYSDRLAADDPSLERDLASIFADGYSERWATGRFLSGWAIFNPDGRTVGAPLQVGSNAARRLGEALKSTIRCNDPTYESDSP